MRIDAHQHFWKYSAAEYPWIGGDMQRLARDFLPVELAVATAAAGIGGSVAVQARQSVEESFWLLHLADGNALIRGVVGWVDLRSDGVHADLVRLVAHDRFVGVRHVVQDEPDPRFLCCDEFLRGLR